MTIKKWKSLDPSDEELLERSHEKTESSGWRLGCLRSRIRRLGNVEDDKDLRRAMDRKINGRQRIERLGCWMGHCRDAEVTKEE